MANTNRHLRASPKPVRARSERAAGLPPEFTARPRPLADELGLIEDNETGLSLDTEDLGSHFLSAAVGQSELSGRGMDDSGVMLVDGVDGAQDDEAASSEAELDVWAKRIEFAAEGRAAEDLLRQIAAFAAQARESQPEPAREQAAEQVHLTDSTIRECSLLDREGAGLDETIAPDVRAEDGGRHARTTSHEPLTERLGGNGTPAANGGGTRPAARARLLGRSLRAKLGDAAARVARAARR